MRISWLKIAWNLILLYKKLPEQEKADFMEILDDKDDAGMEFFFFKMPLETDIIIQSNMI